MIGFATFLLTGLAACASSVKRQTTDTFSLYAYGNKNSTAQIGGWTVRYHNGSAYVLVGDQTISGYASVNFSTTASGLTTEGTVSIAATTSNDTSAVGLLLAKPADGSPLAFVTTGTDTEVTDGWTFFGTMLTYQTSTATFAAVPTSDNRIYELYWIDPTNAPTDSIQVVLKTSAPSKPANPAGPAGTAAAAKLKKREL